MEQDRVNIRIYLLSSYPAPAIKKSRFLPAFYFLGLPRRSQLHELNRWIELHKPERITWYKDKYRENNKTKKSVVEKKSKS